jgi:hypothetical protein
MDFEVKLYSLTDTDKRAYDYMPKDQIRRALMFEEYLDQLTKGKEPGKVRIVLE